uniref:Paired domain-containing protein n=1 Tax=Anopheles minimus TaxID=112268 RepID=A0A182WN27_9DIPT
MGSTKNHKITSDKDRKRIVSAYNQGKNMKEIAEMLQLKHSTVHGIIKRYQTTGVIEATKRTAPNTRKLTE